MSKKQKFAAFCVGLILFALAALFTIGIIQGLLDFGIQQDDKTSFIKNVGTIVFSVYGFSSLFIPVFLLLAGYFCFDADWSWQRAFILAVSIIPFFTLFGTEKLCRNVIARDVNPVAAIKISIYSIIGVLLIVSEYLLASVLGQVTKRIVDERRLKAGKKPIMQGKDKSRKDKKNAFSEAEGYFESHGNNLQDDGSQEKIFAADRDDGLSMTEKFAMKIEAEEREEQAKLEAQNKNNFWDKIKSKLPVNNENPQENEEIENNQKEEVTENQAATDFEPISPSTKAKKIRKGIWSLDDEGNIINKKRNPEEKERRAAEEDAVAAVLNKTIPGEEKYLVPEDSEEEDDTAMYGNFETFTDDDDEVIEMPDSDKKVIDDALDDVIADFEMANREKTLEDNISEEDDFAESDFAQESEMPDISMVFDKMNTDAEEEYDFSPDADVESDNEPLEEDDSEPQVEIDEDENKDEPYVVKGPTAVTTDRNGVTKPIQVKVVKAHGPYKISTDLLNEYEQTPYWEIDEETNQAAANLKGTLQEFNIEAEVTAIRKGPVVTMFEILPAPGVKLSKIQALQDNIALRLAAKSVRIVAPIPGKRAVGIEVPNKDRAIVSFRECIEQDRPEWRKYAVPVVLGKDIEGDTQVIDLVKTPHLLIAGSTGAGKSVCVNSMILSILYKRSPNEVKMILIDPKIVELSLYNGIGHLLTPVITEPKMAMQSLQYCICEMERRYAVLKQLGCRDIASYNQKIREQHIATEKLPYIIVVIDEFADLMATIGKQLEGAVARLAAKARAIGIHLVLATQRPSVDVITGLIKANIPSRIAFMVSSKMDSRIIIDQMGADKLLGKGDMLYASATDPFPVRIQGSFVSDQEVENVVNAVKDNWGEPEYIDDEIFIDDDEDDDGQISLFNENGEDPLYEKALEIVMQAGKASASYIQRRLKIGYNRAARLVEEMEERGIVGPANGSKPREIIHMP